MITIKIKAPAMPEPLAYWFRHINTEGEPTTQWKPVEPRNPHMNTVHDSVTELLAYRYQDKPCYEVSAVHTADQLAARDAQWQEMVGIVAKALTGMLERYVSLVNSGDAGHWDCETEPEVIAARAALSAITEE